MLCKYHIVNNEHHNKSNPLMPKKIHTHANIYTHAGYLNSCIVKFLQTNLICTATSFIFLSVNTVTSCLLLAYTN